MKNSLMLMVTLLIIGSVLSSISMAPTQSMATKLFRAVRSAPQERDSNQPTVYDYENPVDFLDLGQIRRLAAIMPFIRNGEKRSGMSPIFAVT
jgi:hypothetical protein